VVTLVSFKDALEKSDEVKQLRTDVEKFSKTFFMPGFDVTKLKFDH
jgi:hypothetical protein